MAIKKEKLPQIVDEFSAGGKAVCLWKWPDNKLELELYNLLTLKTIESFKNLPDNKIMIKFEKIKKEIAGPGYQYDIFAGEELKQRKIT